MIILRARDIPPDLLDFFKPVQTGPTDILSPSPEPFPGPHFAVFPTGLIEPLIKATCPDRCCPECGAGWSPIIEKGSPIQQHWAPGTQEKIDKAQGRHGENSVFNTGFLSPNNILGYRPTCGCGRDDHVPGVCLDHFFGAGTAGLVCDRLGLDCIGIDISESYAVDIAKGRIVADAPLFADVAVMEGI